MEISGSALIFSNFRPTHFSTVLLFRLRLASRSGRRIEFGSVFLGSLELARIRDLADHVENEQPVKIEFQGQNDYSKSPIFQEIFMFRIVFTKCNYTPQPPAPPTPTNAQSFSYRPTD